MVMRIIGSVVAKISRKKKKAGGLVKKMPTLFRREYDDGGITLTREVLPGLEWVLRGEGEATEKVDGAACAIIGGVLYKRYDAKHGKESPKGAIPCQEKPDPYTGHWPHWVAVDTRKSEDRWFVSAFANTPWVSLNGESAEGTYEAVGLHFQSNPYGLDADFLERHGRIKVKDFPRNYDGMKEYFRTHEIEGIVFWKDGEPRCKIKRSDFGFRWPVRWEGKL